LACNAGNKGGKPTKFEWYNGDTKLLSSSEAIGAASIAGESYTADIKDTSAAGDYKCRALNADGGTDSITQTLIVNGELRKKIRSTFSEIKTCLTRFWCVFLVKILDCQELS